MINYLCYIKEKYFLYKIIKFEHMKTIFICLANVTYAMKHRNQLYYRLKINYLNILLIADKYNLL